MGVIQRLLLRVIATCGEYVKAPEVLSALLGALLWEMFRSGYGTLTRQRSAYASLINLPRRADVTFIFPTRPPERGRLLRPIAWEDARAIDYIQRLLKNFDGHRIHMRDANHASKTDLEGNLVIIGSPSRNGRCAQILQSLEGRVLTRFFSGKLGHPDGRGIAYGGMITHSPSFEQARRLRSVQGTNGKKTLTDYALLLKANNPFNRHTKVIIVAGLRAFGTWGAAKFLYHDARVLYRFVGSDDFEAIVEVTYDVDSMRIDHVNLTPHWRRLPPSADAAGQEAAMPTGITNGIRFPDIGCTDRSASDGSSEPKTRS